MIPRASPTFVALNRPRSADRSGRRPRSISENSSKRFCFYDLKSKKIHSSQVTAQLTHGNDSNVHVVKHMPENKPLRDGAEIEIGRFIDKVCFRDFYRQKKLLYVPCLHIFHKMFHFCYSVLLSQVASHPPALESDCNSERLRAVLEQVLF